MMSVNNTDRVSSAKSKVQDFEHSNISPESTCNKGTKYFKLFLDTSSIHGLNHMVAPGRHPLEV